MKKKPLVEDKEKEFYRLRWEYQKRSQKIKPTKGKDNLFEAWWKNYLCLQKESEVVVPFNGSSVKLYWNLRHDITNFQQIFESYNKRQPTLQEFKDFFAGKPEKISDWPESGHLVLDVRAIGETLDTLVKDFKSIIKEYLNYADAKKVSASYLFAKDANSFKRAGKKYRLPELKRYLQIFDFKTIDKLTWKQIAEKFGHSDPSDNFLRTLKADLQKAKQITANTRVGIFPGEYFQPNIKTIKQSEELTVYIRKLSDTTKIKRQTLKQEKTWRKKIKSQIEKQISIQSAANARVIVIPVPDEYLRKSKKGGD